MLGKYLEKPVRYDLLNKWLSEPSARVLDIGCGNHSASRTKKYYPSCKYYGLDRDKNYKNSPEDFKAMEAFYEVDLNSNLKRLDIIPDEFFDCLILSHTIEHLKDGKDVLLSLLPKLKKGGIIYVETPSPWSTRLPNLGIGLNFYSDPTHIKIYPLKNIEDFLKKNELSIIKSGVRRSVKRIVFLPVYILGSLFRLKRVDAGIFYDITGFANYLIASKN
ncbi:MAG TPA: methyltransferase domain-containing protein [Candidatus Humimicrobiaceae bacterium]|nr:methyltransferase domain-containing protein [Candidatus Humimicrobiaceae bacterium]